MKNWSKFIQWKPGQVAYPESELAIQQLILAAAESNQKIRVIGSGHSFNPLWTTKDILISLDKYRGLTDIDTRANIASFRAGTKLYQLTEILHAHGLALENMGDIDRQSIAGAISTGTHGTGVGFGTMSTQVIRLKIINGKGEVIICSADQDPELFKCAQISLGALGVITEFTLQCVAQFKMELAIQPDSLEAVLNSYQELNTQNRNFEFYWFPNTIRVMTKQARLTEKSVDRNSIKSFFQDYILENMGYQVINEVARIFPTRTIALSKFSARTVSKVQKVNYSHKVFTTPRWVRFNEMEYNIPVEAFEEVVREITSWVNKNNRTVLFPIEHRFVKADDILLSPAYQRDSAYIACHVYYKKDFRAYFEVLEKIFLKYDGRPHWGKIHTLEAPEFKNKYPRFSAFVSTMEKHDPHQIFLNDYLMKIFYGT